MEIIRVPAGEHLLRLMRAADSRVMECRVIGEVARSTIC